MRKIGNKVIDVISPIFGAGAVAACPLCWGTSAVFLSYIGLGGVITVWPKVAMVFIAIGLIDFWFDYRKHRDPLVIGLFLIGTTVLYVGRYHYIQTEVWISGGMLMLFSILHNRYLIKNLCKKKSSCCENNSTT